MTYTRTTWVDEVLAGAERYYLKQNGGSNVSAFADLTNCQIVLNTGVTVAGTAVNAANLNNMEVELVALEAFKVLVQTAPTWTAPTLSGTWANSPGAYAPAGYSKDILGIVRLRGSIYLGGATPLFTLPAGYRPNYRLYIPVVHNGTSLAHYVEINTAGVVSIDSITAVSFVNLDGVTFPTY